MEVIRRRNFRPGLEVNSVSSSLSLSLSLHERLMGGKAAPAAEYQRICQAGRSDCFHSSGGSVVWRRRFSAQHRLKEAHEDVEEYT